MRTSQKERHNHIRLYLQITLPSGSFEMGNSWHAYAWKGKAESRDQKSKYCEKL